MYTYYTTFIFVYLMKLLFFFYSYSGVLLLNEILDYFDIFQKVYQVP